MFRSVGIDVGFSPTEIDEGADDAFAIQDGEAAPASAAEEVDGD